MVVITDKPYSVNDILRSTINSAFSDFQLEQINLYSPYKIRLKNGVALGKLDGTTFWLVYLAVHPENQNVGVGTALLKHAESLARALGARKVKLKAKRSVSHFYVNRGYCLEGKSFVENDPASNYYSKTIC